MTPEAISRRLGELVDAAAAPAPGGGWVGLEHEFRVVRAGRPVDFAALLAALPLGRRYLDPADCNARRLPSGAAVTCDGREAEIALPPAPVRPGFTRAVAGQAAAERTELARLLDGETWIAGCSTHISVSVDADLSRIDAAARLYARTFAPALMLLLDRADSYGVYVRPRPGRLELCGEYVTGERLRAVLAFAVGSVRACVGALTDETAAGALPRPLRVDVELAHDRHGYLVHRRAMGGDLYAGGRSASLALLGGGTTTAQERLLESWSIAWRRLAGSADLDDVQPVTGHVLGSHMLPAALDGDPADAAAGATPRPTPWGRFAAALERPGYAMASVMLTWDVVVLVCVSPATARQAFICVPRAAMAAFLDLLDGGALDRLLRRYLRTPASRRHLVDVSQVSQAGIYDTLGRRRALLVPELPGPLHANGGWR